MSTQRSPGGLFRFTLLILLVVAGCSEEIATPPPPSPSADLVAAAVPPGRAAHATGLVELVWKGSANAPAGAHGDSVRFAEAEFDLHEPEAGMPAKGTFTYRVVSGSGTVHREVTANIEGAAVEIGARKVWYIGRVVADTKGCNGGPGGGHDVACGGDTGGGCSDGHDDGHDGGCSDGHDEGGCTDGGGTTVGGCPDGTHDETEGGCPEGSHDSGDTGCPDGTHDDVEGGCPEGSHPAGGTGGPSGATGRTCRVGQMIVGKAHDTGTPGAPYDGITWKWFLGDDPDLPSIDDVAAWPHLCRKEITGGNLVIHVPGPQVDLPDQAR
jgi:hypothetical protein